MTNQNDEITFSQIFGVMKKSFLRAVIYVLVSVIFVTAILFTVRLCTVTSYATTTLSTSEDSKTTLSDLNHNLSTAVKKAIPKSGLNADDKKLSDAILDNLVITPHIPENIDEETEYTPNSFTLTLKDKGLDLSGTELNNLLYNISIELLNSFSLSKLPDMQISSTLEEDLARLEYIQIADELYERANSLDGAVTSQVASLSETTLFKGAESGMTFTDIKSKLNTTATTINNLRNYIISNKIENISGLLIPILEQRLSDAQSKASTYEKMIEEAKFALQQYPKAVTTDATNGGTVASGGAIMIDTTAYQEIVKDYYELINLKGTATKSVEQYKSYLITLGAYDTSTNTVNPSGFVANTDAKKKDYTVYSLTNTIEDLTRYYKEYTALAEEFNEFYSSNLDAQIDTVRTASTSPISVMIILLADVIVALIAYLIAFFKVYNKDKKVIVVESTQELLTDNTND